MKVLLFGELAEIVGKSELKISAESTEQLMLVLFAEFPLLKSKTIAIGLNNKLVQENVPLSDTDEIAIMPPFSGG